MEYVYQQPLDYRKNVGVVFGSFTPLHTGHLDIIYKAKKECLGGVLVVVCGYEGDKGYPKMPLELRYRLTRQFFKDDPLVAVYAISDDELKIAGKTDQWVRWLKEFWNKIVKNNGYGQYINKKNLIFYVGEEEYARDIKYSGFEAKLIDREINKARGTLIRENPLKYWNQIAQTFRTVFSHNILITGTASEGKTTLTEDIGRYFNLPYSYEWAKDYVYQHSLGDWEFDSVDFLTFLNGQFNFNRNCRESPQNSGIFISDTDVLVTAMYAEFYAKSKQMGITLDEYKRIISPAVKAYVEREHWDKIFVFVPKGEFVNDHIRYMKHSSMKARTAMIQSLLEKLEQVGYKKEIEILDGDYASNFEKVKKYIEKIKEEQNG